MAAFNFCFTRKTYFLVASATTVYMKAIKAMTKVVDLKERMDQIVT